MYVNHNFWREKTAESSTELNWPCSPHQPNALVALWPNQLISQVYVLPTTVIQVSYHFEIKVFSTLPKMLWIESRQGSKCNWKETSCLPMLPPTSFRSSVLCWKRRQTMGVSMNGLSMEVVQNWVVQKDSTQKYDKVCASIFLYEPQGNTKAYRQYFVHSVNHKSSNKYNWPNTPGNVNIKSTAWIHEHTTSVVYTQEHKITSQHGKLLKNESQFNCLEHDLCKIIQYQKSSHRGIQHIIIIIFCKKAVA